jgi:hypothetical protein
LLPIVVHLAAPLVGQLWDEHPAKRPLDVGVPLELHDAAHLELHERAVRWKSKQARDEPAPVRVVIENRISA